MLKKVSNFKDLELFKSDRDFPMCGISDISRADIFAALLEKYGDIFGEHFLGKSNSEIKNSFDWILVETKIEALTNVTAYMLSIKAPPGIGSVGNSGRRDKTLSTLVAFPKKKISISREAELAYPQIKNDVEELKKIFKASGNSIEFGYKKGAVVSKLINLNSNKKSFKANLVHSVDILRSGINGITFNQKSQTKMYYDQIIQNLWQLGDSPFPEVKHLYHSDPNLKEYLQSEESTKKLNELQERHHYELNLETLKILKEACEYITLKFNLELKKPISELENLLNRTIDTIEFFENGIIKVKDSNPFSTSKKPKEEKSKNEINTTSMTFLSPGSKN